MRTYIIPTLLLCVFLMNCKTQNFEDKYSYKNIIIPDSLFKFYPKDLDNLTRDIYSSDAFKNNDTFVPFFDYTCFFYLKSYRINKISELKQILNKFDDYIIDSIDIVHENYSIIGNQLYIEKQLGDSMNIINYNNFDKNKIIFSFNDCFTETSPSETKCGLNKSYKMYILMKGSEFVLPQKYYSDNSYLLDGYRHGYLSGVAYSIEEQKIIYWTCAW